MDVNLNPAPTVAPQEKAPKAPAGVKDKTSQSRASAGAKSTTHKSALQSRAKAKSQAKGTSKQDCVVTMLRRKKGATVAAIMKDTGWQKHSVHGFFASIVRKKLKLNLVRSGDGDKAVYRITPGKSRKPTGGSGKQRPNGKSARKRAR